jgi:hypothetical protein
VPKGSKPSGKAADMVVDVMRPRPGEGRNQADTKAHGVPSLVAEGFAVGTEKSRPVSNVRFGLLVYFGVLIALAAIGVVLSLGGELSDELQLLESVSVTLLCAGAVYASVLLLARRDVVPFAGAVILIEVIALGLALHSIWGGHRTATSGRWSWTFLVFAIACLVVATQRLLTDPVDFVSRWAFVLSALCEAAASAVVIKAIWGGPGDWSRAEVRLATCFYVLGTFGFLFTPAVRVFRQAANGPAGAGPSTIT